MTIALIAHDSKKELMVQFCTAYCRILSQHKLVATGTTGKLIAEATGLQVQRFLAGVQGGDQQIASRIACNEIDLLLFFRDPINAKPSEPNEMTLLRLCDVHNNQRKHYFLYYNSGKSADFPEFFFTGKAAAAHGSRNAFCGSDPAPVKMKIGSIRRCSQFSYYQ